MKNVTEELLENLDNRTEEEIDKSLAELLDMNPEDLYKCPDSIEEFELEEDMVKDNLHSYGLGVEDLKDVMDLVNRKKAGEDIKFKNLPLKLQNMIRKSCMEVGNLSPEAMQVFTDLFINNIMTDAAIDTVRVQLTDKVSEMMGGFNEYISSALGSSQKKLYDDINARYDELISKETDPDKVKELQDIKMAFEEARTWSKFKAFIKKTKIKSIFIDKIDSIINKFTKEQEVLAFRNRYKSFPNSANILNCIEGLNEFTKDEAKLFTMMYCNFVESLSFSKSNHILKNYMMYNILAIPYDKESDISKEVYDNIGYCIRLINDKIKK